MDKQVPIGVVILDLNQSALTERCLASLANGTRHPAVVVLVENGSSETCPPEVADFHGMNLVRLRPGRNLGCAGGRNLGVAYLCDNTGVETCMVLDNDTVTPPEFIEKIGSLDINDLDIAAPVILDFATRRVWSRGGSIGADGSLVHFSGIPFDGEAASVVDWAPGGCLIFSRGTWLQIGEFDSSFQFFFEDVEWCLRVRRAGGRVLVFHDIELLHEPKLVLDGESKARVHLWARNGAVFRLAILRPGAAATAKWILGQILSATHDCLKGRMSWTMARLTGLLEGLAEGWRRNRRRNARRTIRSVL